MYVLHNNDAKEKRIFIIKKKIINFEIHLKKFDVLFFKKKTRLQKNIHQTP